MSSLSFPVLYLNMGCEMLYIIDQRLEAQKVPFERGTKVLHEIIETMFRTEFMDSVFSTKSLNNKATLRSLFEKLAHSSIMKLNAASMAKLYDLMAMAVKYQVCRSRSGRELLAVTLNHLYSLYDYIKTEARVRKIWQTTLDRFIQTYEPLKLAQWTAIRRELLNFFQDECVRVSIFLKEDIQRQNGRFKYPLGGELECGSEEPGQIRTFNAVGKLKRVSKFVLVSDELFTVATKKMSTLQHGSRMTTLGLNMYKHSKAIDTQHVVQNQALAECKSDFDNYKPDPSSWKQLDLLSKLLANKDDQRTNQFKLNLFKSEVEESHAQKNQPVVVIEESESNVVIIDARKDRDNSMLTSVMKDLDLGSHRSSGTGNVDLLDLMDQA